MDVTVKWKGGLSLTGAANSGFSVEMDAGPGVGGSGDGFRPIELLALGLAGCTAMDVISILQKKRQEVSDFEVRADIDRQAEHPRVFTRAVITYKVTGRAVEQAAVVRAIELSATRYCPAYAMLSKAFSIELRYEIREVEGEEGRRSVKQGAWRRPGSG